MSSSHPLDMNLRKSVIETPLSIILGSHPVYAVSAPEAGQL